MKSSIALLAILLSGCAGIPDSTLNSLANAGGGCAKSTGMWGSLLVMTAGTDKGVIRNGEVVIGNDCSGITIRDERVTPPKIADPKLPALPPLQWAK